LIKPSNVGKDEVHVGWISSIDKGENFRKIDIVTPRGKCVSNMLMPSCEGSEDISEDDDHSASRSDVVNRETKIIESLAMGFIVNMECGP
jgi:hypothetical protein